jgi:hypothetical protein
MAASRSAFRDGRKAYFRPKLGLAGFPVGASFPFYSFFVALYIIDFTGKNITLRPLGQPPKVALNIIPIWH